MVTGRVAPSVLALVLVASGARVHAQTSRTDPVDIQTRVGMSLNFSLPKKFESALEYELRMVDNASAYRGSYLTGELGYAFGKHLSGLTTYRIARVGDVVTHRTGIGAQLEQMRGERITISFRPLLQYQKERVDDDGQTIDATTFLRTRLRAKFQQRKHVALYGSVEPYFTFHGDFPVDNWRNTLGVQYQFTKHRKIDVHYIYRPDYAKIYNRTYHTFGVEFVQDLKFRQ